MKILLEKPWEPFVSDTLFPLAYPFAGKRDTLPYIAKKVAEYCEGFSFLGKLFTKAFFESFVFLFTLPIIHFIVVDLSFQPVCIFYIASVTVRIFAQFVENYLRGEPNSLTDSKIALLKRILIKNFPSHLEELPHELGHAFGHRIVYGEAPSKIVFHNEGGAGTARSNRALATDVFIEVCKSTLPFIQNISYIKKRDRKDTLFILCGPAMGMIFGLGLLFLGSKQNSEFWGCSLKLLAVANLFTEQVNLTFGSDGEKLKEKGIDLSIVAAAVTLFSSVYTALSSKTFLPFFRPPKGTSSTL